MFLSEAPKLDDLIRSQNAEAVFFYVNKCPHKERVNIVNTESNHILPLVSAVIVSDIVIFNFLLDNGADPIGTKPSSTERDYVIKSCFSIPRISILELMFLHEKCGHPVFNYFSQISEIKPFGFDEIVLHNWLPQLKKDLTDYYAGDSFKKLKILEKRIYENKKQVGILERDGIPSYLTGKDAAAIFNFKWLIDFLTGLRNEHRKILIQENLKKLDDILNKAVSDPENKRRLIEELGYSESAVIKACEYINEANISIKDFLSEYKENQSAINDENINPIEIIRRMSEERSSNRSSNASSTEVPVADLLGINLTETPTTRPTDFFNTEESASQLRQRKIDSSHQDPSPGELLRK